MRIRSIRPEFWSSEDIAAMSWDTRLVFIGLWSYVDDNGVGRDVERLIVAALFALDEDFRESSRRVTGALRHLSDHGQITRYMVDGRPYLHIAAWTKHQRIEKASVGRYPLPTCDNAEIRESSPTTPVALPEPSPPGEGEKGRRGEGERGDELIPSPATPSRTSDPIGFAEFWQEYPRKVGKDDARKAYTKALKRATAPRILLAAHRYATDPNLPDRQFIPHPSKWLNDGRWDDDPLPARSSGTTPRASTTDQRVTDALALAQRLAGNEHQQIGA